MKRLTLLLLTLCSTVSAMGAEKNAGPAPHDLVRRFKELSCAIVQITSGNETGTGFFITADGKVVTAAHVLLGVTYSQSPQGAVQLTIVPKQNLKLKAADGTSKELNPQFTSQDADRATADVAVLDSGVKPPCYLHLSTSDTTEIGGHLLAIGYPSLSPTPVLYEGFLSAKHQHLPIPVGHIGSTPVFPTYQVMRIQMPITPGASGSPVIDDDNHVVGIISEVPVLWSNDLNSLVGTFALNPKGSGILLSGFDTTKILAQLAWVVHEFESPGSGLAVPTSYLQLEPGPKKPDQSPSR